MAELKSSKLNLVCIDGSEQSEHAFNWYVKNYHQTGDVIGFVHIERQPSMPIATGFGDFEGTALMDGYFQNIKNNQNEATELKNKYQTICERKKFNFKFFMLHPHHSPGHLICETEKKEKAASIIMGQRGLGMISRMLLGSTSDYVLHHTNIPVTVVPMKS